MFIGPTEGISVVIELEICTLQKSNRQVSLPKDPNVPNRSSATAAEVRLLLILDENHIASFLLCFIYVKL